MRHPEFYRRRRATPRIPPRSHSAERRRRRVSRWVPNGESTGRVGEPGVSSWSGTTELERGDRENRGMGCRENGDGARVAPTSANVSTKILHHVSKHVRRTASALRYDVAGFRECARTRTERDRTGPRDRASRAPALAHNYEHKRDVGQYEKDCVT